VLPLAAGNTYYFPIAIPATTSFDRIAVRTGLGFSGTSSVRLGIYNSSGGKPTTVLLDAGTVSCTSAATTFQITINQQINTGFYFLAVNSQTNASTNVYIGTAGVNNALFNGSPNTSVFSTIHYFSQSGVTGAYATAGTLNDGLAAGAPIGWLRAT
jgi:hypothetical protein